MIETSHIAIHIWDENRPSLVQCDVYSCAEFSASEVFAQFNMMEVVKMDYLLLDRAEVFLQIWNFSKTLKENGKKFGFPDYKKVRPR